MLGHRRVEGGIEDGDHGDVRAERRSGCPYAREARSVVEGRQRLERFNRLQHVGVDQDGLREARAPVDHAVSDRVDPERTSVLGCTARRQPAEHPADGGLVVWDGLALASRRAPFRLEHERRPVPDALDEATRQAPYARQPRTVVVAKTWNLRDEMPQLRARTITARTRMSATASGTSASMRATAREDPVTIGARSCLCGRQLWPFSAVGAHGG
jgi:hypothetical protein